MLQATLLQSRLRVLAVGYLGPLKSSTPTHVQPDVCGLWTSFLLQCRRLFGVVTSGTPVVVSSGTFCNLHHRRSWGSLFARLLHGQCATSPQTDRWVIHYVALKCRTIVASGTRAVASSGTVYSRRRARAGSSLFVQRSATSVSHGNRSCSDVGMSVVVASGTRAVGWSGTAYDRRHLRANRLAFSMVTKCFAVVASGTRVVGSPGTAYGRRRLNDRRLGRHAA